MGVLIFPFVNVANSLTYFITAIIFITARRLCQG